MNNKEFIDKLTNTFPEIKEEVMDEDFEGLITLQIGCFMRYTQKAIDTNNEISINNSFQFVLDNLESVNDRIENALYISFLNKLSFTKNISAKSLLPPKLLAAKNKMDEYDKAPHSEEVKKFLDSI